MELLLVFVGAADQRRHKTDRTHRLSLLIAVKPVSEGESLKGEKKLAAWLP
jgi:hypothetical protein